MSGEEKPEKPKPTVKGEVDKKRDRRDAQLSPDLTAKIGFAEKEARRKELAELEG